MTPIPLSIQGSDPFLNPGDIVTIEGMYNRPSLASAAWWAMLVLGPAFAARHVGWAFRRKASDPYYQIPMKRKGLMQKRKLQTFVVSDQYHGK